MVFIERDDRDNEVEVVLDTGKSFDIECERREVTVLQVKNGSRSTNPNPNPNPSPSPSPSPSPTKTSVNFTIGFGIFCFLVGTGSTLGAVKIFGSSWGNAGNNSSEDKESNQANNGGAEGGFLSSDSNSHSNSNSDLVGAYQQCGGKGYSGATSCAEGYECERSDEWYSQCRPSNQAEEQDRAWQQCGGPSWTGSQSCGAGWDCVLVNPYYSQCKPGLDDDLGALNTSNQTLWDAELDWITMSLSNITFTEYCFQQKLIDSNDTSVNASTIDNTTVCGSLMDIGDFFPLSRIESSSKTKQEFSAVNTDQFLNEYKAGVRTYGSHFNIDSIIRKDNGMSYYPPLPKNGLTNYKSHLMKSIPSFTIFEVVNDTHATLTYGNLVPLMEDDEKFKGKFQFALFFDEEQEVIDANSPHYHYSQGGMHHSHSVPHTSGGRVTKALSKPMTGRRSELIMDVYYVGALLIGIGVGIGCYLFCEPAGTVVKCEYNRAFNGYGGYC